MLILGEPTVNLPENTIHQPNVGPMLVERRRRWTNIGPTLGLMYRVCWATISSFLSNTHCLFLTRGTCRFSYWREGPQVVVE